MKIKIDTSDNYSVAIELEKGEINQSEDIKLFDSASVCVALIETIVEKYLGIKDEKEKIEMIDKVLDGGKKLISKFKKDLLSNNEEERLYNEMEKMFDEFLRKNDLNEQEMIDSIKNRNTYLDVILENREAKFSILDVNTKEVIYVIYSINLDLIQHDENNDIPEAVMSQIIVTVLYDKAFGEDTEKNIARKIDFDYFEKRLKVLINN